MPPACGRHGFRDPSTSATAAVPERARTNEREQTMQQIQVKTRPRPRDKTPADPPTINRKIARIWFPESQPQATRNSAG
jgi:hypothetical protein